jgi:DnaD/phage-associated family protein|tara:strand:+ start:1449 stop:2102 length:654 start_codon:yes stop_codon:yes gene_type:complete
MTNPSHESLNNVSATIITFIKRINDLDTLKCMLRILDIVAKANDAMTIPIQQKTLLKDALLLNYLGKPNEIMKALQNALQLGLLSQHVDSDDEIEYTLIYSDTVNYNQNQSRTANDHNRYDKNTLASTSIFKIYEENIGLVTPLVAESLAEAEKRYSSQWIVEAFKLATTRNKRSWAYISRILERWFIEGKTYGDSRKYSKKVTAAEYIQRHGLPKE